MMMDYWTMVVGKHKAKQLRHEVNSELGRIAVDISAQQGTTYYLDAVFSADEVLKYELDQDWSLTK